MSLFDWFSNAMPKPTNQKMTIGSVTFPPTTSTTQNQIGNIYANQLANGPYTITTSNNLGGLYNSTTTLPHRVMEEARKLSERYVEEYMASTPESKVKAKVKKALDDMGVYYCMPLSGGYGNSGVPDIIACVEGHFFGIECKAGKNKTTALQEKHLSDIGSSKGSALVIDETNVDSVSHLIIAKLGEFNGR